MVFNLDPLDISLDFESRRYRLGDTINATVMLIPNSDVEIREATLNLIAEVRRTEVKAGWAVNPVGERPYAALWTQSKGDASAVPTEGTPVPTKSTEVCFSTSFVNSASLSSSRVGIYKVGLKIGPDLPKVAQEAKDLQRDTNSSLSIEQWWLEVQVDVAMGRDQSIRKEIDVTFS